MRFRCAFFLDVFDDRFRDGEEPMCDIPELLRRGLSDGGRRTCVQESNDTFEPSAESLDLAIFAVFPRL